MGVGAGKGVQSSDITLTSGKVLIGDASNLAAEQTISGDITISAAGVAAIGSDKIINADVKTDAAIAFSKLAALTDTNILVGNGSNVAAAVAVSGDATLANTGALTLANTAVTPGSYTLSSITVDSKGRITAASSGAAAGGQWTLISEQSPSAASVVTFSSLTARKLFKLVIRLTPSNANPTINLTLNNDSTAGTYHSIRMEGTTITGTDAAAFYLGQMGIDMWLIGEVIITGTKATGGEVSAVGPTQATISDGTTQMFLSGNWSNSATEVTRIDLAPSAGTFTGYVGLYYQTDIES